MTASEPGAWTESQLLEQMLNRNAFAWKEFHSRYDRLIYRCIHKVTMRFTSVVTSDDVKEIYAMLCLNLTARDMHKLRLFDPARGNKLSSWIGLLATNTAWDHLRTIARQPQCTDAAVVDQINEHTPSPCDQLIDKERWGMVNNALERFSSKDRRFVRMYYVDGMTPEEIAERMQISVKTVYSKKHKIRCRLEQVLQIAA